MNDKSGLTMALDLEFLLAGLTGERRANGSPSADGNDGPQSRIPALLRRTNEGRASETVVIQRAPRGVGWLQEFIAEICADKMLHDRAAETLGEPVLGLAPFLMHWANSRFGMRTTVGLNLWTLHQALVAHRSRSVEAATVMLFLELPETPQLNRMLSFYLHCRAYVSNEIVAIEPPRGEAARSDNTNSPSRRLKDSRGARGLGGGGGGSFSDSFSGSLAGSFRLSSGPGMPQGAGAGPRDAVSGPQGELSGPQGAIASRRRVSWAAEEQLCDVHLFEAQSSDTDEEYEEWSANFRRERQTRQRNKGVPMSACKLRPSSLGPLAVCGADDLHCLEGIDDELESPRDLEADESADGADVDMSPPGAAAATHPAASPRAAPSPSGHPPPSETASAGRNLPAPLAKLERARGASRMRPGVAAVNGKREPSSQSITSSRGHLLYQRGINKLQGR